MTSSRRDAHICRALIAATAVPTVYFAVQPSWWAAPFIYTVVFLGWCERRLTADHRRHQARHDQARRTAGLDAAALQAGDVLVPCCSFWRHSGGAVHGPACTTPPEAQYVRDGLLLDENEAAAFDAINRPLRRRERGMTWPPTDPVDRLILADDIEIALGGGCGLCGTEKDHLCACCRRCRCFDHDTCTRPA